MTQPLPPNEIDALAALLRALANPARLRVALRLHAGACTVTELEAGLGLRQPNLSQHLATLREAGVVVAERHARNVTYALANAETHRLLGALVPGGTLVRVAPPAATRPVRSNESAQFARVGPE